MKSPRHIVFVLCVVITYFGVNCVDRYFIIQILIDGAKVWIFIGKTLTLCREMTNTKKTEKICDFKAN